MAIGVSDGSYFEDMYEAQMAPYMPASLTEGGSTPSGDQGRIRLAGDFPRKETAPLPGPRTDWPTMDDVEISRQYDLSYGDPSARYIQPGLAGLDTIPVEKVPRWFNEMMVQARKPLTSKEELKDPTPEFSQVDIDQGAADYIHRAWLASRRSAVSQLGFDMGHTVLSPTNTEWTSSLMGLYEPGKDRIWANSRYESSIIHESIHRGVQKLMKEGVIPELEKGTNEYLTRLLMHRHFRSYEVEDLGGPAAYKAFLGDTVGIPHNEKFLDRVEKAAADYIAKKRPGGPR